MNLTLFKCLQRQLVFMCFIFIVFICLFSSHGILSWLVINLSINRQSSEDPCAREITGGGELQ